MVCCNGLSTAFALLVATGARRMGASEARLAVEMWVAVLVRGCVAVLLASAGAVFVVCAPVAAACCGMTLSAGSATGVGADAGVGAGVDRDASALFCWLGNAAVSLVMGVLEAGVSVCAGGAALTPPEWGSAGFSRTVVVGVVAVVCPCDSGAGGVPGTRGMSAGMPLRRSLEGCDTMPGATSVSAVKAVCSAMAVGVEAAMRPCVVFTGALVLGVCASTAAWFA